MSVTSVAPEMVSTSSTLDWTLIAVAVIVVIAIVFVFVARGRASAEARAGLALGVRGLLGKDIRSRNRGWRPVALLTGYLGIIALALVAVLGLMRATGLIMSPTVGTQLFSALGIGAVLLLAFITPALTVGAISGERERRTLDLLLVTRASPLGLAWGKLVGSLSYVVFLLVASLPAFALVYLFGGVPAIYVVMILAVAIVTSLAHASLGLLLSALLRRTIVASVVAYLVVMFLMFGLPVVSAVSAVSMAARPQSMSMSSVISVPGAPPAYTYASPLTSISSVLPANSTPTNVPLVGDLMRALTSGGSSVYGIATPTSPDIAHATYVTAIDQQTGQVYSTTQLAPWVYHFAFSGILAILCVGGTALLLAPVKPWKRAPRPARQEAQVMSAE